MSRKFCSSAWPFSEAMLSGWNCTPCTGWVLCITPWMTPSSLVAVTSSAAGMLSRRDGQRMIARGEEIVVQAAEHALAGVMDAAEACHASARGARTICAAIDLADGLMAQAYAQDRHAAVRLLDQSRQMPASLGVQGPGDSTMPSRLQRQRLGAR